MESLDVRSKVPSPGVRGRGLELAYSKCKLWTSAKASIRP